MSKSTLTKISLAVVATSMAFAAAPAMAMTLKADKSGSAITVDGNAADWASVPSTTVALKNIDGSAGNPSSVEMKTAVRGDTLYVLATWADSSENKYHKPYKWSGEEYAKQKDMEDRFAFTWPMDGDFSTDKTSGNHFKTDIWHWKAERSNNAGVAHDKYWVVSGETSEGATALETPKGAVYLDRPSDEGDKLYRSTKPREYEADVAAGYKVTENPEGSIADVKAKGVWANGKWTLELARKLNTGNADDAVIPAAGTIKFGVAAFDGVDAGKHTVSEELTLDTK